MEDCNPKNLPLPAKTILKPAEDDDPWYLLEGDEASLYRQIVGSILYLSNGTRPDISFSTGQLARFMSKPNSYHLSMAKHLLKYLRRTRSLGITYRPDKNTQQWEAWSDATWGTESDKKSFQGYTVIWNGGAVTWSATRQKSTAQSSMEAEIMAASEGAKEMAWMEKIATDTATTITHTPILRVDNEAAVELAKTTKFHNRAKHIDIRHFFVRDDMVAEGRLKVVHVAGTEQTADVLTKALAWDKFTYFSKRLGLLEQKEEHWIPSKR